MASPTGAPALPRRAASSTSVQHVVWKLLAACFSSTGCPSVVGHERGKCPALPQILPSSMKHRRHCGEHAAWLSGSALAVGWCLRPEADRTHAGDVSRRYKGCKRSTGRRPTHPRRPSGCDPCARVSACGLGVLAGMRPVADATGKGCVGLRPERFERNPTPTRHFSSNSFHRPRLDILDHCAYCTI